MSDPCPICNDLGLRLVFREDGERLMQPCDCRIRRRAERFLTQANIPRRYQDCLLDNYETHFPSAHRSLSSAHLRAKKFVESYPLETGGTGLLLTGSIGVGKTHLAVGILHALVTERGATGLFVDYRDLLKQTFRQQSTTPKVVRHRNADPRSRLREAGSSSSTNSIAHLSPPIGFGILSPILNTRYNDRRTTIITTQLRQQRNLLADTDPGTKQTPEKPCAKTLLVIG